MQVESVAESVDVVASTSGIDTTATAPSAIIDRDRIEELPVQTRNYLDFVLLTPGVVATPRSRSHATAADSGFSFAGQRSRSNVLTIDGLNNNDEYSGAARTELSLETIQEFDVVSHGSGAEVGGGAGGTINVVTKSGTNVIHGDAFVFAQDGRLDAHPFGEDGSKPELRRYRTGGAVGGPIVRDRTFYYLAGEYESSRGPAASQIDAGTHNAIGEALSPDRFPTGRREIELSGKLGHQLTPASTIIAKLVANNNREIGDAFDAGRLVDRSARSSAHTKDVAGTATLLSIVGTRGTNELRTQWARRSVDTRSNGDGPGVVIAGVAEFGMPYGADTNHRQRYIEIGDTATIVLGHHLLRIGGDATRTRVTGAQRLGGAYFFRSLDAFLTGAPDQYRQAFGDPHVVIDSTKYSAFVQDDWTRGNLTLSGGLRFDAQQFPGELRISSRQLQPRFGVAWTPRPNWVVRGTAGTFADRIPLVALEKPLTLDGVNAFEQVFDGTAAADVFAATRGGMLDAPSSAIAPSRYAVQRGNWRPSSRQFSLSGEHAFTSHLSASVTLLRAEGRHLLRTVNTALLTPQRDADVFELQPTASSRYTGCTFAVNQRMAEEMTWAASYTLSKSMDDASDF
ncbi:MAG TPA: TonB-dependent receptor, partial [Thermoanaerobaculia bacterium]